MIDRPVQSGRFFIITAEARRTQRNTVSRGGEEAQSLRLTIFRDVVAPLREIFLRVLRVSAVNI
jgi:hypothetical protein